MTSIAVFISPHGFGHAARACAVVAALRGIQPSLHVHLFTTVPPWFFSESLQAGFTYHSCEADVGLAQASPLTHDAGATVKRLLGSPWNDEAAIGELVASVGALDCRAVLADVSPLGLRVGRVADLPTVLIENFTWQWIYDHLADAPRDLRRLGRQMTEDVMGAELHIQATPCCDPDPGLPSVEPVARAPRLRRVEVRRQLQIPEQAPMVLASMGGIRWTYRGLERHAGGSRDTWVVVPGGSDTVCRRGRLVLLPFHGPFYHPDLVAAADVVVGKLGYSTVAEVAGAGSALAYVARPDFPESEVLERFVHERLAAREIEREAFAAGEWMPHVDALLAGGRPDAIGADGAAEAAGLIFARMSRVWE